jgi:protein involved in plasmid replication-relaxation
MLNERDQEILKAVHFYRYMTVQDVTYLMFSETSISHVREILSRLCGKADKADNKYLYRFRLPKISEGNAERVYVLGARGREFLNNNTHLFVNWYASPARMATLNYNALLHSLAVTRVLVAAAHWSKKQSIFKLVDTHISYGLAQAPNHFPDNKRMVIPDGWLLFERQDEKRGSILLEIDRGTEYQERFKQHIASRLEFVRSGKYEEQFGVKHVTIAYVNVFEHGSRRQSMLQWTRDVLQELGRENWGSIFKFTSMGLEEIYEANLFEKAVWYSPFNKDAGSLF